MKYLHAMDNGLVENFTVTFEVQAAASDQRVTLDLLDYSPETHVEKLTIYDSAAVKYIHLPDLPAYLLISTYLLTYATLTTSLHAYTYLPTHLSTHVSTYLRIFTYLPVYTSLLTYLFTYLPLYLPTYLLTHLRTYYMRLTTYTYLFTYLPPYLPTYLLTHLHTYYMRLTTYILPTCLPVCIYIYVRICMPIVKFNIVSCLPS